MMLDEVSFGIDGKPYIYLGVNDYSNNLSKVYFKKNDANNYPKLEIFYSKWR